MPVDIDEFVKENVPYLLSGHRVRLQGDDDCKRLIDAIIAYVRDLLGDTQAYIERNLTTVGPSKLRNREKRYLDQVHKVILIYCQIYVERVQNRVDVDSNGFLVCGAEMHDVDVLRTSWDAAYSKLTGQGPKRPHGGKKRTYVIGFPFRKRVA